MNENFKAEMNRVGLNAEQQSIMESVLFGKTSGMTRYLEAVEGKVMIDYAHFELSQNLGETLEDDIVICPTYMTEKAVGADCFASERVVIGPNSIKIVPTGIKAKFNGEEEGLFPFIRSSIPKKKGLMLANGVGVIEEDYHGNPDNDGNIGFMFWNFTGAPVTIERFERIGQIVLMPILRFENAGRAGMTRGKSGSTGR